MKAAAAVAGCPRDVAGNGRPTVSGVKVAGMQRCGDAPHGYLPPRLDWRAPPFVLNKGQDLDVRVLVDRSIVEVFFSGGRAAALMSYQVRKTPSWADFSLLPLYSHRNARASLHLLGPPT